MISVPYLFICDDIKKHEDGGVTVVRLFDTLIVSKLPTTIESFNLVFGLIGSEKDDGQLLQLRFRGKQIPDDAFPFPYHYRSDLTRYVINVTQFPIIEFGIIFIEISYQNKVINKYPLIIKKEEK